MAKPILIQLREKSAEIDEIQAVIIRSAVNRWDTKDLFATLDELIIELKDLTEEAVNRS